MTNMVNAVNECNKAICSVSGRLFMANLSLNQELIATDPVLSSELEKACLDVNKAKGFIEEIAKYIQEAKKSKFPNVDDAYKETVERQFSHTAECQAKCEQSMKEALAKETLVQAKPELSIDSAYAFLLEDRAIIKKTNGYSNEDKEFLMKNSEQISDLLKTKHWAEEKNNATCSAS